MRLPRCSAPSSVELSSGLYPVWMEATPSRPVQARSSSGALSFLAGLLAAALSVGGQLLAARKQAGDWNAGHPMADQPFVHALSVTPGIVLAILACGIGCYALWRHPEHRGLAAGGVALGLITAVLTMLNFPGSIGFQYWYDPQWEDV